MELYGDKGLIFMVFGQKLDFLIKTFNSSNSKLARAIRVDPSLVSKWRRGNRTPAPDSPHVPLIISYFLNINALQHQKDALMDVLRSAYPAIKDFGSVQAHKAVADWLFMTEDTAGSSHVPPPVGVHSISINNMFAKMSILSNISDTVDVMTPQAKSDITIKPGEQGSYEVFKGLEGKRQAVMNFLSLVMSSPRPLELLLFSEEDLAWLVGDPEFFMNWGRVLRQVLLSGHKVTIIHHVNRDPARIMSVIDQWVPLHLTGRLESYYYPKYTEKVIKSTLFIARGTAAIIAVTPENGHDTNYTFFHRDPLVIRLAEENYLAFLLTCRRLVHIYKSGSMGDYYREICALEERPGFLYVLKNAPTSLTMPVRLYKKLLDGLGLSASEKKERLELHQKRTANFNRNLLSHRYREFINIEAFETNLTDSEHTYNGLELFNDRAVRCSAADYIEHISHIIDLLRKYENYEVILFKLHEIDNAQRMYLTVKEDSSVVLSTCDDLGHKPIAIIANQDNIANAFEEYFDTLVEHVPASRRNKSTVIKKLQDRVDQIRAKLLLAKAKV